MTAIRVRGLSKRFGAAVALDRIDLEIAPGELFFLLGPSGCGKTTLLRALAGFHDPDQGSVLFGDEDVTGLPPHRRNTGMMFQSYALWPHLTVEQNVAFGLEERGVGAAERRSRALAALQSVRMDALAGRKPNELSGGQQQRVALARALVVRPRCLLLDEPLSNLDARLRGEMRLEIRRVAKEFGLTTVYVTHDQKEALSIADRIAVMDSGRVIQVGSPWEVYRRPLNRSVAAFLGEPGFIAGCIAGHEAAHAIVDTAFGAIAATLPQGSRPEPGTPVTVSVRPECWVLGDEPRGRNWLRCRVASVTYQGETALLELEAGSLRLHALEINPRPGALRTGECFACVEPEDAVVLTE